MAKKIREKESGETKLGGGFNPSEKYQSIWIISPSKG